MNHYRCDCGDTECPSCGTAQGTYPTDAERLRSQLTAAGLSVRGGAKALGLSRDKLRQYTEGHKTVPEYLWLALERLITIKEQGHVDDNDVG